MNSNEESRVLPLPVIVGFGGVNAAGRTSFHHAYRRMILDALSANDRQQTLAALGELMGLKGGEQGYEAEILAGTLVRRIEPDLFDVRAVEYNHSIKTAGTDERPTVFEMESRHLPDDTPEGWFIERLDGGVVRVTLKQPGTFLVPATRELHVQSAGQLPSGFEPGKRYPSRNHPRGLQMTVYGASDALQSTGINWEHITQRVAPDQISVYAGSGMSQLDPHGNGGMMAALYKGKRVTSKQCPFGFAEMPADFVNAYVLGSLGTTGTNMGACASFLYNLRQAVTDIQTGRSRVVIVGNSEAPIVPEIIEGYAAMGALATDNELRALDDGVLNHHRACRPFGNNCGFTLAESAQFVVLFDDALALELGAQVHGAVTDVFINADGHKKSIAAPGVGNYLTMAKALASARGLLGEESVRRRSFVQAHGTGTPQNRVTESDVLDRVANLFGIQSWPVVAVKNFLGHSIGAAGADQLIASLGVWEGGILPGITNTDVPADDVHRRNLYISSDHKDVGADAMDSAIINAKGFGGNNASAVLVSPAIARKIIQGQNKSSEWKAYCKRAEKVAESAREYDQLTIKGETAPVYKFDHNVLDGDDLVYHSDHIEVPGFTQSVSLKHESPYSLGEQDK